MESKVNKTIIVHGDYLMGKTQSPFGTTATRYSMDAKILHRAGNKDVRIRHPKCLLNISYAISEVHVKPDLIGIPLCTVAI